MRPVSITILLIACSLALGSCGKPKADESSAKPANSAPAASSPSSSASASPGANDAKAQAASPSQGPIVKGSSVTPAQPPGGPSKLVGSYTIHEVHQKGVVTMIPHQIATQITFLPDGSFSRTSKAQNKENFKDSGQFVIEGRDQLVLKIVMSGGKIQQPPVEKRHTFSLSEDGSELKMTSKDGKVAVFRR